MDNDLFSLHLEADITMAVRIAFRATALLLLLFISGYAAAEAVKGPPIGESLTQLSSIQIEEQLQVRL